MGSFYRIFSQWREIVLLLRAIKKSDLNENYLSLLDELSLASHEIDLDKTWRIFTDNGDYHTLVVEDHGVVTGTASLLIERKIRGRKCGHIEDVVVLRSHRKSGVGRILINGLIKIAEQEKCYKVILNCSDNNVAFYNKLGFLKIDNGMRLTL